MGSKNKKNSKRENNDSGNARGSQGHENQRIITDPRFASVHSDPRFQNPPKHKSKVEIDSRFSRMFTDKNFSSSSTRIDKRGKLKKDSSSQNPLRHYYRLDEEEGKKLRDDVESDKEESAEKESESENAKEKLKKVSEESSVSEELQSESEPSDSEEEDEHDSVVDTDNYSTGSDLDNAVYSEQEETLAQEENVPEIDKETHRLAVVNMDWNQVKAVDLYVLLSSFLPKGGQILSASVYPSEFGLKRMEEEAVHGPVGLFDNDKEQNASDEDDDDEMDTEKLRAYELSRLRYYYAVVECDSIATADYLYKRCDGVEFERSSNKLDLRFIPDSMEFKHAPRDVATEVPGSYQGIDFQTRALQQSNIHLTWDEDEPQRSRNLKRKFNDDQLAELELEEFLASDESGSDEDGENDDITKDKYEKRHKKKDLYRALIQSGDGSDGDEEEEKEEDQEMEVTFNTGLEDISKRILEKKDKKSETVWEAYLRNRKEKKKARKNRKESSEDESSDTDREPTEEPDDFFVEEPSAKKSKEARGKSAKKGKLPRETAKEAEASNAELELLLADENGDTNVKGYNLKSKKSKGKKGKEISDEEKIPTIDLQDPRFSCFKSPIFALDPTDPQFKRSATYYAQQIAKQKGEKEHPKVQGQAHLSDGLETEKEKTMVRSAEGLATKKDKHELSSLVKSIKMKSKQIPVPSNDKMSGKKSKMTNKLTKKARIW